MAIKTLSTIEELSAVIESAKSESKRIGVVPTMGALHAGHLSLAKRSVEQMDVTIATIFVNPTQFSPSEDLDQYPRTLESDLERLDEVSVDYAFVPTNELIYPAGCSTTVNPPLVSKKLEGEFRPTHFGGVATVVLKLLNLTQADVAFFGQKDFQQVMVIQQMVADLNVACEISVCPIVRDEDGLALSSRNAYLSSEEREVSLSLSRTLDFVEQQIRDGQRDGFELITEMRQQLIDAGVDSIDYAIVANPNSLDAMDQVSFPAVALIAAHVGKTRLIDNRWFGSPKDIQ